MLDNTLEIDHPLNLGYAVYAQQMPPEDDFLPYPLPFPVLDLSVASERRF